MGLRERLQRWIARQEEPALAEQVTSTLHAMGERVQSGQMTAAEAIEHAYELGWRLAERRFAQHLAGICDGVRSVSRLLLTASNEMAGTAPHARETTREPDDDDADDECFDLERIKTERPG